METQFVKDFIVFYETWKNLKPLFSVYILCYSEFNYV